MKPSVSTVMSAALGTPIAVIASWTVKTFAHIEVPGEVQAAIGSLLSALIGYFFIGGQAVDTVKPDDANAVG
jgi:hypothetical protein